MDSSQAHALALLCRVGFQPDLIDELTAWYRARALSVVIDSAQAGVVRVGAAPAIPRLSDLVFARDLMIVDHDLPGLDNKDRVTPIGAALDRLEPFGHLRVLAPDSDATKPLAPLLGALEARLRGRAVAGSDAEAIVWMMSGTHALVGRPPPGGGAAYPGGIPRLKFPREAPSRSTLKLDEAFQVLLTEAERGKLLRAGASAVDLGAAPGGWTYQLVMRQMRVTAIDNGRLDARLLESGKVQHLREDGFRYRPAKPVDWLVCDMVEKPGKVAELIARWFSSGWCQAAVFNLKLPMKRRFEAWQQALELLEPLLAAGFVIRARQLYHDREEITVAIVPTGAPRGARPSARLEAKPPRADAGVPRASRPGPRAEPKSPRADAGAPRASRPGARAEPKSKSRHPAASPAAAKSLRADASAPRGSRPGARAEPKSKSRHPAASSATTKSQRADAGAPRASRPGSRGDAGPRSRQQTAPTGKKPPSPGRSRTR